MKDIKKHADGLMRNAQKHLKRSLIEYDGEALHKLRLEIKKMRALLHLLSYCFGYNHPLDKKLKKLFKRAGRMRDLQLLIQHLEEQFPSKGKHQKELFEELKQQLNKKYKKFSHRYRQQEAKPFAKTSRSVQDVDLKKPLKDPALYFKMMKEKISRAMILKNLNEEQNHNLRKDIKSLKYNLALAKAEATKLMDGKLLDKWAKLLGGWHDEVQFAKRLDELKNETKPELHKELRQIRKVSILKSKSLLKEFAEQKPG